MPNEILLEAKLQCSKDGASISKAISKRADLSGNNQFSATQSIGTAAEVIAIPGDMTDRTYILIENLDDTNYVEISTAADAATNKFTKLSPGDFCLIKAAAGATDYYAKANTAPCIIQTSAVGA